ncbi:hypothetical protein H1S01_18610 [Heliobacterium chlorum]|uniref:Metallo-beta-lactamase domain-containing protein n=1 Tax=Heliobacterium chlorum TaxID=2698 RepID=A0ABR7T8J5_HELCL|nr:MBL fold metallo-hydrolase [Heliobacterium chlorum]MBC9786472.1 hypothetical protein [Heliobacterium chlorum]
MIRCLSKFSSVGQGLFYKGVVQIYGREFSFVYDCGTDSPQILLKSEITRFCDYLKYNSACLDLLVISHYDRDHVSGLEFLFDNINVDTVVIPYVSPKERLILGLKNREKPLSYYKFLSDPVKYFISKGVRQLIILGQNPPEDKTSTDDLLTNPDEKLDSESVGKVIIDLEDDHRLINRIRNEEPDILGFNNVLFKQHNGCINFYPFWEFKFFNNKVEEKKIAKFFNALKSEGIDFTCYNQLKKYISKGRYRRVIKKSYKKIFPDINDTSIVMHHGPSNQTNFLLYTDIFTENNKYPMDKKMSLRNKSIVSSLSTSLINSYSTGYHENFLIFGDINLNKNLEAIKKHFRLDLQKRLIILVPHHGSSESWNLELLKSLRPTSIWIVSAGIVNKYKHPGVKFINDFARYIYKSLLWSNETNAIYIKQLFFKLPIWKITK